MTGQEITTIIDKLAEKLGTTGEHLVEAYIPWVIACAYTLIGAGIILFLISVTLSVFIWKKGTDDSRVGAVIIFVVGFIFSGCFIGRSIPNVVASEAAAITKVLALITQ